jgi:hypothetical protein
VEDEAIIRERIALLKEVGFSNNELRAKVQFYVYVDNDSDVEYNSGLYRCRVLKKLVIHLLCLITITGTLKEKRYTEVDYREIIFWLNDITDFKDNKKTSKNTKRLHQANA